jgi:hypothetical protein
VLGGGSLPATPARGLDGDRRPLVGLAWLFKAEPILKRPYRVGARPSGRSSASRTWDRPWSESRNPHRTFVSLSSPAATLLSPHPPLSGRPPATFSAPSTRPSRAPSMAGDPTPTGPALRLSQPLSGLRRPGTPRPSFMPLTPMGFSWWPLKINHRGSDSPSRGPMLPCCYPRPHTHQA